MSCCWERSVTPWEDGGGFGAGTLRERRKTRSCRKQSRKEAVRAVRGKPRNAWVEGPWTGSQSRGWPQVPVPTTEEVAPSGQSWRRLPGTFCAEGLWVKPWKAGGTLSDLAAELSHEEAAAPPGAREELQTEREVKGQRATAGRGVEPVRYSPEPPRGVALSAVSRAKPSQSLIFKVISNLFALLLSIKI